jgi:FkbM family methyltransferase
MANRLHRRWPSLYVPLYSLYKRATDRAEMRAMRGAVRPGMTCADVGANVGFYTRYLSRLAGPTGSVFSFEPSPDNFAILRRRIGPNVRPFQAAVGATTGETALYLSEDFNVDHRTYPTEKARRQIGVPQVRLDDVLPAAPIDFVKMDIQGYELQALGGMAAVLGRSPRLQMIVEFWPWGIRQAGDDPGELLRRLEDGGFSLSLLTGEPLGRWVEDAAWYCNLFAARRPEAGRGGR